MVGSFLYPHLLFSSYLHLIHWTILPVGRYGLRRCVFFPFVVALVVSVLNIVALSSRPRCRVQHWAILPIFWHPSSHVGRLWSSSSGYFSTTSLIKEKATPLQAALAQVADVASLEVMEKLCYNIVVGTDPKYRSVKLENPKINKALVSTPNALDAMRLMGWKEMDGLLQLDPNVQMSMDNVREVQAAITALKRETARVPSLRGE